MFCKDSRNKKAVGVNSKRNNHKEVLKRMERMQEKALQADCASEKVDDSTDEEIDSAKSKKYGNGKAPKEQKKQLTYEEAEQLIEASQKGKKKGKKI